MNTTLCSEYFAYVTLQIARRKQPWPSLCDGRVWPLGPASVPGAPGPWADSVVTEPGHLSPAHKQNKWTVVVYYATFPLHTYCIIIAQRDRIIKCINCVKVNIYEKKLHLFNKYNIMKMALYTRSWNLWQFWSLRLLLETCLCSQLLAIKKYPHWSFS